MSQPNSRTVTEKLQEIKGLSVNASQIKMIDNLKDLGLLNAPKYSLACGPTAKVNPSS
ncbi:TPA: hypothetical protein ACQVH3_001245 [Serratia marcescens]